MNQNNKKLLNKLFNLKKYKNTKEQNYPNFYCNNYWKTEENKKYSIYSFNNNVYQPLLQDIKKIIKKMILKYQGIIITNNEDAYNVHEPPYNIINQF